MEVKPLHTNIFADVHDVCDRAIEIDGCPRGRHYRATGERDLGGGRGILAPIEEVETAEGIGNGGASYAKKGIALGDRGQARGEMVKGLDHWANLNVGDGVAIVCGAGEIDDFVAACIHILF